MPYAQPIQEALERDRRLALIKQLQQEGPVSPTRSGAVSSVLSNILANHRAGQLSSEYDSRQNAYQQAMADYLSGDESKQSAALGNADFAPMVQQMQFKKLFDEPKRISASDLVQIEGDAGPEFTTADKAVGRKPIVKPGADNTPSNVAEWIFYNSLSEADREKYLTMKRASKIQDFGGFIGGISPTTGAVTNLGDKTVSPDASPALKQLQAAATERGRTEAEKENKVPAVQGLDYTAGRFNQAAQNVDTGGWMGLTGQMSKITDSQDAKELENIKQQMSTELRTIFRIPGEGTLSDKEQAQYGLQLPDITFDKAKNEQIIRDLQNRARLRTGGQASSKTVVRTGRNKKTGKKVVQYSDGSTEEVNE